jgi:DHA1 family bicyclomycin/chloramphenicol resistance-like MFS transporter
MGVAPVIAPSLGSWILTISDWRSIFYFLFILVTVVISVIFFFYKDAKEPDTELSLKFKNVFIVYGKIFQNSTFTLYSIARGLSMSVLFAYLAAVSFVLMNIYGVSKTTFGWMFGLNALGFILGSQINKILLKYYELEKLTFNISLIQTIIVGVVLILANVVDLPIAIFSGFTFTVLFFVGIINPNTTSLALAPFDKNAGSASALTGSMLMGIGAVVSATIGEFYNGTIFPLIIGFLILCSLGCLVMYLAKRNSQSTVEELNHKLS